MFDLHMMDYWLHKMSKYRSRCIGWEMARRRAYQAAYACGYLEHETGY